MGAQIGFCNKAMWFGWGGPAGTCSEPAYGPTRDGWNGVPLLWACELHGGPPQCPETEFLRDAMMKRAGVGPYAGEEIRCDCCSRTWPERSDFARFDPYPMCCECAELHQAVNQRDELLEALKAVVTALQIDAPGTPLNNRKYDALGAQVRAAIAKAERGA